MVAFFMSQHIPIIPENTEKYSPIYRKKMLVILSYICNAKSSTAPLDHGRTPCTLLIYTYACKGREKEIITKK